MGMSPEQRFAQLEFRLSALERDVRAIDVALAEFSQAHNRLAKNAMVIAKRVGVLPEQSLWRRFTRWLRFGKVPAPVPKVEHRAAA